MWSNNNNKNSDKGIATKDISLSRGISTVNVSFNLLFLLYYFQTNADDFLRDDVPQSQHNTNIN